MDFNSSTLFGVMKRRLAWLTQRQEVLAQNVANADTPGYRPRDVEAFRFGDVLRPQVVRIGMETTRAAHLGGHRAAAGEFAERKDRDTFEVAPAGNAVILEEQMAKVNETAGVHRLTTQLYRKHLEMVRMVAGSRQ